MSIQITDNVEKVVYDIIQKHKRLNNDRLLSFFMMHHTGDINDVDTLHIDLGEEIHTMISNRFYAALLYAREGILLNEDDQDVLKRICMNATGTKAFDQVKFDTATHHCIGEYVMRQWGHRIK